MSCGPAQAVQDITKQVDGIMSIADKALTVLPLGIASVPGFVEATLGASIAQKVKLAKQLLEGQIPSLPSLSLPQELTTLIETGLAGAAALTYLDDLKDKYKDVDVDIDNVVDVLNSVGNDLDQLCKLVPNIQDIGGNFVVKGFPVSFPQIDPLQIIEEGKFPDIIGNVEDALKSVELDFEPDLEKVGEINIVEEPGAPFRLNGSSRSQRTSGDFFGNIIEEITS